MKNEILFIIAVFISFSASYLLKRKFGKVLQFYSNGVLVGMSLTLWITNNLNMLWGCLAFASFVYNIYSMNSYVKKYPEAKHS